MELLNLIKFTHNRYDLFKYIVLIIVLIIIFNRWNDIFSYKNISTILVISLIIYCLIKLKSQELLDDFKQYKYKLNLLKDNQMSYINHDIKILHVYSSIIHFKRFNKYAFRNSMKNMNHFLKIYSMVKYQNENPFYLYQAAEYRRDQALNHLMSIVVNTPISNSVFSSGKTDDILQNVYDTEIKNSIKELRQITRKYLYEIEDKLNKSWSERDTYNYSQPIYSDEAKPNPSNDLLFSDKFNIY